MNITQYRNVVELKSRGYEAEDISTKVGISIADVQTVVDFMFQKLLPSYYGEFACLLCELQVPYEVSVKLLCYLKAHDVKLNEDGE